MICDPGERYLEDLLRSRLAADQGLEPAPYIERLEAFAASGRLAA
jgi:hypothetical protein